MQTLEEGIVETDPALELNNRWSTDLANSAANSKTNPSIGTKWSGETFVKKATQETLDEIMDMRARAPNPKCTEILCSESFWVPENNLCLFCGHRG